MELALEAGAAGKTQILNILHRLIDGAEGPQARIQTPAGLALRHEPRADPARYDALRATKEARHAP